MAKDLAAYDPHNRVLDGNGASPSRGEGALVALTQLLRSTQFLQRLGYQYGTKRDVYAVAGYPRTLDYEHFWALYRRGDIAGRLVDIAPQTTWRRTPEITEPGVSPDQPTDFMRDFNEIATRLKVWSAFERVDRLAGIGQFAILLIGVPGEDRELRNEMPTLNGPGDVLYLAAYPQGAVQIESWEKNQGSPRFGLPLTYRIKFSYGVDNFGVNEGVVHHSRVLHVAEDRLSDQVFGRPRLERVFNRLMDLEKIAASTGEAFWQLATRILTAKAESDVEIPDAVAAEMSEQIEEIIHDLRRIFIGQGVDLKWLESTPPDPSQAADFILTLIAGATGWPKRILFGSETGERASEQDQRHFLGMMAERQQRFAEPDIVRAFIDVLVAKGAIRAPTAGRYTVTWPALFEMSEKERAETNHKRAMSARALAGKDRDAMELVEVDVNRDVWLLPHSPREGVAPPAGNPPTPSPTDLEETPPSDPSNSVEGA